MIGKVCRVVGAAIGVWHFAIPSEIDPTQDDLAAFCIGEP